MPNMVVNEDPPSPFFTQLFKDLKEACMKCRRKYENIFSLTFLSSQSSLAFKRKAYYVIFTLLLFVSMKYNHE